MLGEPTNDLDTDMLAAMEDLLDSWPGTLIVVSHDRYFLERVTDQQYAILDHGLRHLPGGVDQYLELRAAEDRAAVDGAANPAASGGSGTAGAASKAPSSAAAAPAASALSGAELRAAQKELNAVERRMQKLQQQIVKDRDRLATLDQSDYQLLNTEMAKITAYEAEIGELEEQWLDLSEQIG
ncbi:ABC transporter, ATP-binding protein [Leucobacter sp. 7(1)]|uniref:hypothetical protein n=1 Tax=Leucobacter sp. 7(1) TaxID=1255613 RepID=UPI00097EAE25|nr:ABC transporter, ATP-binding protein [Leucobacter sp. 7(1)]